MHRRGRDRRGAGLVVLLELGDDEERRDLGLLGQVARDEHHRAVLAEAAGERDGRSRPEAARREGARTDGALPQVIVASSSSVYGANPTLPKREDLQPMPLSPYAASKAASGDGGNGAVRRSSWGTGGLIR